MNKITSLKKTRFGIISSRKIGNIKGILQAIREFIPSLPENTDIVAQKFHDNSFVRFYEKFFIADFMIFLGEIFFS